MPKKCKIMPHCPYARYNWFWRLRGRCDPYLCAAKYTTWKRLFEEAMTIAISDLSYEDKQDAINKLQ